MTDAQQIVRITAEGQGFRVQVEPDHPAHPPLEFADHRTARGRAGGIRMVTGWRLVDDCKQPAADASRRGR